jgi:hypothetical protein
LICRAALPASRVRFSLMIIFGMVLAIRIVIAPACALVEVEHRKSKRVSK